MTVNPTPVSGDVVPFVPRDDAPVRRRRPVVRKRYCRHLRTELEETSRRVYCADCEEELDAFDVLVTLAHEFERYESARDEAKRLAKQARKGLDELLRQERNAKARLRRLGSS